MEHSGGVALSNTLVEMFDSGQLVRIVGRELTKAEVAADMRNAVAIDARTHAQVFSSVQVGNWAGIGVTLSTASCAAPGNKLSREAQDIANDPDSYLNDFSKFKARMERLTPGQVESNFTDEEIELLRNHILDSARAGKIMSPDNRIQVAVALAEASDHSASTRAFAEVPDRVDDCSGRELWIAEPVMADGTAANRSDVPGRHSKGTWVRPAT
jgi:hypothetical protein